MALLKGGLPALNIVQRLPRLKGSMKSGRKIIRQILVMVVSLIRAMARVRLD